MSINGDLITIDLRAQDAGEGHDIPVPAGLWLRERAGRVRLKIELDRAREELVLLQQEVEHWLPLPAELVRTREELDVARQEIEYWRRQAMA